MNNKIEHHITKYKNFLFQIHGRPIKGILSKGVPCTMEDPTPDKTYGDVVHPCVRYIPEGFEGHQWWMVYTPYYGKTDGMENPRLCYADAKEGEVPTTWKFYCIIKDKPEKGNNSDPTLIFHCNKLYVFWRENETDHAKDFGYSRAISVVVYNKKRSSTLIPLPSWRKRFKQTMRYVLLSWRLQESYTLTLYISALTLNGSSIFHSH